MSEEKKEVEILEENTASTKHSFFSRLKKRYKDRKARKLQKLESEKLSEEEQKKVEEKIEEASQEVKSQASDKKKKIKSIIFFIFNIVLVAAILIWNIYTTDDFMPLSMFEINYVYVFAALALLVCILIFDVLSVHRMIYRKTMRSRWHLSYKSIAILRYYDAVTPLSSGGQAFMTTYLTGRDVPGAVSLSIPMAKLVFQNIAWLVISFVCLIISFSRGMGTFVSVSSIIGFVLAFCMIAIILFFSFSKKLGQKLVAWGLRVLVKLRILKNYDKYYKKVLNFIEDYQNIMKEYGREAFDIIYQIILHGLRFICLYSIPFFIYCSFMGFDPSMFSEFFIYTALIELASSFIPLPGGTGMNEITFTFLFKQYLGGATFWALILWRFCSYYFYLLQGLGILSYDTIYGNRKYRWIKAKMSLQAESQEFRRVQIENFRMERNKRRKQQNKEKRAK
ncbi:MAG: flippase-like domain-containing protein [Clostridia bacterium]|nr:flippase-like domain-containing protein [Clostridia bacterium]